MPADDDSPATRSQDVRGREWIIALYDENGSFERFKLLPVRAMRLVVASASLTRIRALFEGISNPPQPWEGGITWVGGLPNGNGEERPLYWVLRRSMWINLEGEEAFASALVLVEQALPAALPTGAGAWQPWRNEWQSHVAQVEDELSRLGAQEGLDPFDPQVNAFLVQDASVNDVKTLFRVASETWRHKLLTQTPESRSSANEASEAGQRTTRGGGRPRIALDYETVAAIYWDMATEGDELNDVRFPTQKELIQRLAARGVSIGSTTLIQRIKEWKDAGLPWPPPNPDQ